MNIEKHLETAVKTNHLVLVCLLYTSPICFRVQAAVSCSACMFLSAYSTIRFRVATDVYKRQAYVPYLYYMNGNFSVHRC